jgi:hypothetical protein
MTAHVFNMETVSAMAGLTKPTLKPKYIILDVNGVETPFLFPAHITHLNAVPSLDGKTDAWQVVSAGFYRVGIHYRNDDCEPEPYVTVFDGSFSLGVSSRPEDAAIIAALLK